LGLLLVSPFASFVVFVSTGPNAVRPYAQPASRRIACSCLDLGGRPIVLAGYEFRISTHPQSAIAPSFLCRLSIMYRHLPALRHSHDLWPVRWKQAEHRWTGRTLFGPTPGPSTMGAKAQLGPPLPKGHVASYIIGRARELVKPLFGPHVGSLASPSSTAGQGAEGLSHSGRDARATAVPVDCFRPAPSRPAPPRCHRECREGCRGRG